MPSSDEMHIVRTLMERIDGLKEDVTARVRKYNRKRKTATKEESKLDELFLPHKKELCLQ